jgi:hypothetical protein
LSSCLAYRSDRPAQRSPSTGWPSLRRRVGWARVERARPKEFGLGNAGIGDIMNGDHGNNGNNGNNGSHGHHAEPSEPHS